MAMLRTEVFQNVQLCCWVRERVLPTVLKDCDALVFRVSSPRKTAIGRLDP